MDIGEIVVVVAVGTVGNSDGVVQAAVGQRVALSKVAVGRPAAAAISILRRQDTANSTRVESGEAVSRMTASLHP